MGQGEVMEVLESSDKPLSVAEIAEKLGKTKIKVFATMKVLLKFGDVKCIELDRYQAAKRFGWKNPIRRVRVYYV